MENNNEKLRYEFALERVAQIKKFYTSVAMFFIVLFVLYGAKYIKYGFPNWSNFHFSVIFVIWGLILAIKGFKLFILNAEWEKEMINKELKKQNNGNH